MGRDYESLTIDRVSNSGKIVPREDDSVSIRHGEDFSPGQVWKVKPLPGQPVKDPRRFQAIELVKEIGDYTPKYGRSREEEEDKMKNVSPSNNASQNLNSNRTPKKAGLKKRNHLLNNLR